MVKAIALHAIVSCVEPGHFDEETKKFVKPVKETTPAGAEIELDEERYAELLAHGAVRAVEDAAEKPKTSAKGGVRKTATKAK
jgi:hypothetical protein